MPSVVASLLLTLLSMSNERKARQCVDSMVQGQNVASKSRKSVGPAKAKRLEKRGDRPLNFIGCLALLHAVRSVG